jgi:FAD/FMN-containing dehydrogenase
MREATSEVYRALRQQFRGDLLRPHDPQYESARGIWNGMVARRPGLIARCSGVADVQAAVRTAVAAGVLTAIRCGGHSLAGFSTCDDGMVIDLSSMRQVAVDREARRCRFAGGCLLGTLDAATQKEGLAFPAGVVSRTGASGLVLGGGFGWLTRLHGLSSTCFRMGSKFRCIRSTPTDMQSTSENDFECFASTGVNAPLKAMF